jgi:glycosyltransferase involved in cell wall biosynthesis/tetratricopeptide (TPR) repeat protein
MSAVSQEAREMATQAEQERRLRERGRLAFQRGDYAAALEDFDAAAAIHPRQPWAWLWVARARLRLGDRAGSYAAIERALGSRPMETYSNWHMIQLLEGDGRLDECRERALTLCEAHAHDPAVTRRTVALMIRLGDIPAAGAVARSLVSRDEEDATGHAAIACSLEHEGRIDEAEAYIQDRLHRGAPNAALAAATFHLWAGRARAAWAAVRGSAPEAVGAAMLAELGHALRGVGELEAATAAFRAAASVDPGHGRSLYWAEVTEGEAVLASGRWRPTLARRGRVEPVTGRVLHLVGKSTPHAQSGYTIRTQYLTVAQKKLGLEPHVVTQIGFPWTVGRREASPYHVEGGVPHHHLIPADGALPVRPDELLTLDLVHLAPLVRAVRPAVLHAASDFRNGLLALRLRDAFGLPMVYEVRGFWEESWLSKGRREAGSESYRWRQERETECMLGADAVVTLSEGMAHEIAERGVPTSKIDIVPNGVDLERFVPVARDPELARRVGVEPQEVTLGYVSTFTRYEGVQYLLAAARRLLDLHLPVRVVLVGEGEELPALRRQAFDLGIDDRVAFCGRVRHDEVLSYYGLIDIFVVPRTSDRVSQLVTPLKPYEAMATGRAVVVSDVEALRSMVLPGSTAEVFIPEDADDLARVAARLIVDPALRARLGSAARAWVVEHRDWAHLAARYLDVYRRLGALA